VHQIISMIKWIRTSRLSINNCLARQVFEAGGVDATRLRVVPEAVDTALFDPTYSPQREFFIDNLLVRIHLIIEMILVDRPCAMGV